MKFSSFCGAWLLYGLPSLVRAVASADEYRDADEQQSSYLANHNMDPNVVNSNGFGILWSKGYNAGEIVSILSDRVMVAYANGMF